MKKRQTRSHKNSSLTYIPKSLIFPEKALADQMFEQHKQLKKRKRVKRKQIICKTLEQPLRARKTKQSIGCNKIEQTQRATRKSKISNKIGKPQRGRRTTSKSRSWKNMEQNEQNDAFLSDQDEQNQFQNKMVDQLENQKESFHQNYLQTMKKLERYDQEPNQKVKLEHQEQDQLDSRQKHSQNYVIVRNREQSDKNQTKIQFYIPQKLIFRPKIQNINQLESIIQSSPTTTYEQICNKVLSQVFQYYKKNYLPSQRLSEGPSRSESLEMIKKQFLHSFTNSIKISIGETATKCQVPMSWVISALQESHL